MEISLGGKVAVVTGSSSGIGLEIVRQFLNSGAGGVVAVFRRATDPPILVKLRAQFGDQLQIVRGDVGEEKTALAYTRSALDHFGRIDVLICNAAVSVVKAIHEHTPEEWDAVFNSNVKAVYWASRHAVPVMIAQGKGLILISGSISGEAGIPTQGAYGPSKGALHQMTRQMAVDRPRYC